MPHRLRTTTAALAVSAMVAGCAQQGGPSNETLGTLGGAAGGAIIGSQIGGGTGNTIATAVGAIAGALAGRELGRYLSDNDQERAQDAEHTALAQNEAITWNNPESGHRGTIQPVRTYTNETGDTCRDYTHTIYVSGRAETARGTACRQGDGTWRVVG